MNKYKISFNEDNKDIYVEIPAKTAKQARIKFRSDHPFAHINEIEWISGKSKSTRSRIIGKRFNRRK